ncbi:hypothetical protein [Sinorhizobium mexicanum]|uniref:Uncharacterized protein n=1 Tax=Sinorhizobium mexicanum TaxID=375549 RepID=A0A859QJZ9_9HYPH|nr:hypothetical protein [Sinorhizobium mexicanum]MBP1881903.1 hypothetical protein [Sinorhizobium mexicanum]QLL61637.1 hypothetical protein FKV68_09365 [Sinorhizobium mexicanum]
MFTALFVASLLAPTQVPSNVASVDDLQADFEHAVACEQIDGRKVWKGEIAYYIQSYVYEGDATAQTDAADAVLPGDNTPETVKEFERACAASVSARSSR